MSEELPPQLPPEEQQGEVHIPVNGEAVNDEAAQGLGEAAVDQVTQVPDPDEITDDTHQLRVNELRNNSYTRQKNAVDHSIDPETGEPKTRDDEPDTRIQDPEKAHAMAKAGDYNRTFSAYWNLRADKMTDWEDQSLVPGAKREDVRKDADRYLGYAEIAEKWAGALHDHQPSEAYKAANPDVAFTANGLSRLDQHTEWLSRDVGEADQRLEPFENPEWGSKHSQAAINNALMDPYSRPYEPRNRDLYFLPDRKELAALLDNPSTSMEDIKKLFVDKIEQRRQERTQEINEIMQVLDDVASGHAAEYQDEQ